MIDPESAGIQAQIENIQDNQEITQQQKISRVSMLRQSQLTGTDSSFKVITSVANTMIGSAIIVYPILFIKDGLFGSLIIMLMVGIVQYFTCRLLVIHNRRDEFTFSQSVKRIGGKKMYTINALTNILILFFVCIAYFLLIVENFFQVSVSIINIAKHYDPPKTNTINFSQYSIQYATFISAMLCVPFLFMRSMDALLKIFKYTIYLVAFYGVFIVVTFFRQIIQGHIVFGQYKLFDPNFSNVAGAFALSFLIHPTAAPILKKNVNQDNNKRDLLWGYVLTAFIYFFVGFIGGLTCGNQVQNILDNPDQYSTVFDCVNARDTTEQIIFYAFGKIVQFGIFLQNIAVLPIINFLARKQFVDLVGKEHLKNKLYIGYTVALLIASIFVSVFCIDVAVILSFDGAILGFLMGYGVPITMHLICLYRPFTPQQKRLRASLLASVQSTNFKQAAAQQGVQDIQYQDQQQNQQQIENAVKCNPHGPSNKKKDYIIYGLIMLFGIAVGCMRIYGFVVG